jgi:hypothetical protein
MNKRSRLVILGAAVLPLAAAAPATAATTKGAAWNMILVGHHDLANRGFDADVWVHAGHAYVGSWGFQDWSGGGETGSAPTTPTPASR